MNRTFKRLLKYRLLKYLTAIASSYYQRLASKIKHVSGSLHHQKFQPEHQTKSQPAQQPPKFQQDPFLEQQGLMFCSRFPEQPLRPNTLSLTETGSNKSADAFWYRLTGHAKGHYSLAIVNRALAAALYRKSNAQACFVPFDDGLKKSVEQMPEDTDLTLKQAINNSVPTVPDRPVVSIVHHYPVILDEEPADIRLIIFFWEESLVPSETISILNENFDAILVATSFVATILRNSGCAIPVFVIPMGIDHIVDYSAPQVPLPPINDRERFRFLHVSSVFDRKGPEFLLAAFIDQFNAEDPVELYIKTFPNPHNRIHEQLAYFTSTKPNPPRVIIDEEEASNEDLQALYRSAHTLVLPTRGEGFNLPAAEALALGLPVIVTGFGAQTDFCTMTTASLIPFRFDLSQSHLNQGDGCWVTPDVSALARLMQQSVDEMGCQRDRLNPSEQITQPTQLNQFTQPSQRRAAGHALMRSTYTWDQSAQGVANALHWLQARKSVNREVSIKHLSFTSWADVMTLAAAMPQEDALVISLDVHPDEANFPVDSPDLVLNTLATPNTLVTLTKYGKILILDLPTLPDFATLSQPQGSNLQPRSAQTCSSQTFPTDAIPSQAIPARAMPTHTLP
ncbi:glycosyltransferase family 4 protein, partial [Zwartia sp.]|uniref:glycosyltransferase family 4 protein n=1 Tax=Zwartia sp. TaxID=2978004 RepID=UPI002719B8BD